MSNACATTAQREWAYQNLRSIHSESEIANMDDDEVRDVFEYHHDGRTIGATAKQRRTP